MRLLGIDYGRRKIGLALSEGKLAEPFMVIRWDDQKALFARLKKIVSEKRVEKIVVGLSESEMGRESKRFSLSLSQSLRIPVETYDETLTTYNAKLLSREAGVKRVKRKALEDAYAAALMLQAYLDSK